MNISSYIYTLLNTPHIAQLIESLIKPVKIKLVF